MRLTVVGQSAAAPSADGPASGYLVETDQTTLLLDCGPGVTSAVRQPGTYHRIDALIISHMHADHCLDLMAYAYSRIRDEIAGLADGQLPRSAPVRLYLPPGGADILRRLTDVFADITPGRLARPFEEAFLAREYDPDEEIVAGDARICFAGPMRHGAPSWGIRVTAGGRSLAYSGDTAYCPALVEVGRDADLFLCEATYLEQHSPADARHLTAAEAGRAAAEAGPRRLLLTHLQRQDLAYRARVTADAGAAYSGPLEIVRAGQTFDV